MENSKRENLIKSLAASMGAEDLVGSQGGGSRFNPDTGTLFCNGYVVSRSTIDEAREFFERQARRYANATEKEVKNMSQLYSVGAEAIKMMQNGELGGDYQVIRK